MSDQVLLAGWGIETRSWVEHASRDEDLSLVSPSAPSDLPPVVTYLGDRPPAGFRPSRILRSPGFRPHDPALSALVEAGVSTTTPTGDWFARRPDQGRVIAVTGSKAKSSTSWLIGLALRRHGVESRVVGNIGTSVWDVEDRVGDGNGITVVELSSYQCHDLPAGADLAAITFLAVDHLDWHGTVEAYHAAKLRLFELTAPGPCLTGNQSVVDAAAQLGVLARLARSDEGNPRSQNATLAAAVVGVALELDDAAIVALTEDLISSYPILPGRLATIGWIGSCEVIDDALGSNPTATAAALQSVRGRRVAWLMGGASRGVALDPLVEPARLLLRDGGTIVTFGVAGAMLRESLRAAQVEGAVREVASLDEAVAVGLTRSTEVLLFSPSGPTPSDEGTWKDRSARLATLAKAAGMTSSPS